MGVHKYSQAWLCSCYMGVGSVRNDGGIAYMDAESVCNDEGTNGQGCLSYN
jgi:hypothetical protein